MKNDPKKGKQKVLRVGDRTGSDHLYDGKTENARGTNAKRKGKRLPRRAE